MRCSFVVLLAHGWESPAAEHRARSVRVTVLSTMLATRGIGEWGFAAIVEVDGRRILFDTGAIAGLTWWNFYCQFFKGSIRSPQVVEFLKHLMRHIPGPMILIWDRLSAHKSRMVQNFIAERHGRIHTEYVPVSGVGLKSSGIPVGSREAA